MKKIAGLELEEDIPYHEKFWKIQRAGWLRRLERMDQIKYAILKKNVAITIVPKERAK